MTCLPIIVAPDPRLKRKSFPVERVDDAVSRLMSDMLETMYAAPGIGLAAIQVGIPKRIIVVDVAGAEEPPAPIKLANPELVEISDEDVTQEEGCLSLPDQFADVVRPQAVTVRYLDEHNVKRQLRAEGMLATCIQHEIDHLEGILFVDRISAIRSNIILRRLVKARKAKELESAMA